MEKIYWENGFYFSQNDENTRTEISSEYRDELLEGQAKGKVIYDDNGYPRLKEPDPIPDEEIKALRIAELKDYLNNTWSWQMERYNAEKMEMEIIVDGKPLREKDNFTISLQDLIVSRKEAVDEINRLEKEIN